MVLKTLTRTVLATVLSAGLIAGQAQARQLTYAMGFPPKSDSDIAGQNFAKTVEELTNGELTVKVFPLSLLNFAENFRWRSGWHGGHGLRTDAVLP